MKIGNLGPIQFQAKWPDKLNPELRSLCSKVMHFFLKVLSLILFPIFLIQSGISKLRQYVFNYAILPGAKHCDAQLLDLFGEQLLQECNGKKATITAPDGIKLDGAYFPGASIPNVAKNLDLRPSQSLGVGRSELARISNTGDVLIAPTASAFASVGNQIFSHVGYKEKAVILGFGNGQQWETIHPSEIEQLQLRGISVYTINPRSVGKSEQVSPDEQGLALDTWSAYEFLKSRGYKDILFMGHSMGGATTALGAALVQEQYPEKKICAVNMRSFSKLSTEVKVLLGNLASFGIRLIGAEIDSAAAFKKLKGEKAIFWVKSDDIIPYPAQMHPVMKDQAFCYQLRSDLPYAHNRPLMEEEQKALYDKIAEMLGIASTAQTDRIIPYRAQMHPVMKEQSFSYKLQAVSDKHKKLLSTASTIRQALEEEQKALCDTRKELLSIKSTAQTMEEKRKALYGKIEEMIGTAAV